MGENIRTWVAYLLLICALIVFTGMWVTTGHLVPLAFLAIAAAAWLIRRHGTRRRR